jgi:hypothetical protein
MNKQIFSGPALPRRVRTAFAFLDFLQTRRQPCCHPPGDLSKQEIAAEAAALRTLVQFMTGEEEFVEPPPPPLRPGDAKSAEASRL